MFLYTLLAAIGGIVAAIVISARTKKADGIVYGRLDKAGRVTNVALSIAYATFSPVYLFLGIISEPCDEWLLFLPSLIVSLVAASAAPFCALGLGSSIALRRRGMSKASFAVQFAGLAGIVLTVLLYGVFVGTLISPLN